MQETGRHARRLKSERERNGVNADTSQGARAARGFPRCNGTQVSKFGLCERCRRLLRMRVLCELVIAQCVLRDVGEVLVSLKYH